MKPYCGVSAFPGHIPATATSPCDGLARMLSAQHTHEAPHPYKCHAGMLGQAEVCRSAGEDGVCAATALPFDPPSAKGGTKCAPTRHRLTLSGVRGAAEDVLSAAGQGSPSLVRTLTELPDVENNQYVLEGVTAPETPYLEDPLYGKIYSADSRSLPLLWFACFPGLYALDLDKRPARTCLRQLLTVTVALSTTQIVTLVAAMSVRIEPLSLNNLYRPSKLALVAVGARDTALMLNGGQWWRLLSPVAVHAGVVQAVVVGVLFLRIGSLVELRWGPLLFTSILAVASSMAMAASTLASPNLTITGSAAALAAVVGAWVAEQMQILTGPSSVQGMRQAKVELAMGLVATGAVVAVSFGAYNDIVATLIGLLSGALLGLGVLAPREWQRGLVLRAAAVFVFLALAGWLTAGMVQLASDTSPAGESIYMHVPIAR